MTAFRTSRPPPPAIAEREIEAVTIAMVVAPGVYARNRMFDFFRTASAQQARKRAATIRGIIPQLARASSITVTRSSGTSWTLRYIVVAVSLTRVTELTDGELAALRIAAERAKILVLPSSDSDKDLVLRSLAKLMDETPDDNECRGVVEGTRDDGLTS